MTTVPTVPTRERPPLRSSGRGSSARRTVRADGIPKVKGEFEYSSDMRMDGMLWGATLRSPHPRADIWSLDISRALAIPGVRAVLTHEDVPGRKLYGMERADQPVLAWQHVRYQGEPIAIVAADHPETARRAADAIEVDYDVLEPLTDPERAMAADAPQLHLSGNVLRHVRIRHGDADADADVVVTGEYEVGMQDQAFLGPESGLAVPDGEGGVDLYIATQWLHVDRDQLALSLDLPPEKVRLTLGGVGGAFGGREDLSMQIHACMLALHTGRPVKMVYSREESFFGHVHRHPCRMRYEHGATATGGSCTCARGSCSTAARTPRARRPCARTRRASPPGRTTSPTRASTPTWPTPTTRRAARCAGSAPSRSRSPTRRRWTSSPRRWASTRSSCGSPTRCGRARACRPARWSPSRRRSPSCSSACARCRCRPRRPTDGRDLRELPGGVSNTTHGEGVRRGVGYAVGFKNVGFSEGFDDYSTARVRLSIDGGEPLVEVHTAAVEVGQGLVTVQAQIARTELGVERVAVLTADTRVGSAGSSSASRQTYVTGGAVKAACEAVRERLGADPRTMTADELAELLGEDAIEETVEWRHRADVSARRERPGRRARRSSRSPPTGRSSTSTSSSGWSGSSSSRPRRTSAGR